VATADILHQNKLKYNIATTAKGTGMPKKLTLQQLVRKICKDTILEISEEHLLQIQNLIQTDGEEAVVNDLIHCVLIEMKKENNRVRRTLITLANHFFQRSLRFRQQLCPKLSEFVPGIGSNHSENQPGTATQQSLLRIIAEWNYEYGKRHPQLRAYSRYLKEALHLPLPDIWVRKDPAGSSHFDLLTERKRRGDKSNRRSLFEEARAHDSTFEASVPRDGEPLRRHQE
jgi:hypothetical protein